MNIVAIGGGDKTPAIQHALDRIESEKTDVLLVPTACSTPNSYTRKTTLATAFFHGLGVDTRVLHDYGEQLTPTKIQHEIGSAALIYTIGGNSPYMLRTMRAQGIDHELRNALMGGTIHAGTSAGALLPFEKLHSNPAAAPTKNEWDYEILDGLGVLRAAATAHADQHDPTPSGVRDESRFDHLLRHLPLETDLGFGIDNHAALIIDGPKASHIQTHPNAHVRVIRRAGDTLNIEMLDEMDSDEFVNQP